MTTAHTIRKTTIFALALIMISVPFTAAAGTSSSQTTQGSLANTEWSPEVSNNPEAVYGKLKAKSQQVCGSSDIKVAGGLTQSRKVEECFEGTLTAAVNRLDNPEVTALHQQ